MKYDLIHSEVLYPGRAFTVRRDRLRLPNGGETSLDVVDHVGSVVLLPLDAKGDLLFVRQYRHPTGLDLLELPAGMMNAGETPEACARREVREETGMAAGQMVHAGGFYLAPGYSTEYMNVFIATDLRPDPLDPDADEFLQVEAIPLAEVLAMAERGEIPDAKSLAAFLIARPHLTKA